MTKPIHPHNGHILGQRVRSLRLAHGFTQAHVARAAGITEAGYSRIEHGRVACPRPETIQAMARLFGVDPTDLVSSFVPPKPKDEGPGARDKVKPPKPPRPQVVPRASLARPLDPAIVALADAVLAYDPDAVAVPSRIRSEMGLGSTDAVAVLLSNNTLMLLRHKQDWADYLAQQGDLARLRPALEALAAVPDAAPPRPRHPALVPFTARP